MKLSTRSRYGARIVLELARRQNDGPVRVGEISNSQQISVKYIEQRIRALKQADSSTSVRGPKGGHVLTKKPGEITLGQIVRLFEGQSELVECISTPDNCPMAVDCRVRLAWKRATQALYRSLDGVTIADLMKESIDGFGELDICSETKD